MPLGIVINDAVGHAFQNSPGIASGKGPYLSGGSTIEVDLYETVAIRNGTLSDGTAVLLDDALTYTAGLKLFASENGYLTCVPEDAYEVVHGNQTVATATVVAIVLSTPNATNGKMFLDVRI